MERFLVAVSVEGEGAVGDFFFGGAFGEKREKENGGVYF